MCELRIRALKKEKKKNEIILNSDSETPFMRNFYSKLQLKILPWNELLNDAEHDDDKNKNC